jgi:uncharacterized membrane protein (DUF4010 family)
LGELDLSLAWEFTTALAIGALLGIERERHKQEHGQVGIGGLRTFVLFALLGALCGWLAHELASAWIIAAGLLATAAIVIAGYVQSVRVDPDGLGQTTEIAAMATFLLGTVATLGYLELAVGLGVAMAALLAYKEPLHGFVGKLGRDDALAVLRLLIATFIVLPLLPDRPLDPWDALNPRSLWLLVLLISGLSLVGYVLTRWLGAEHGIPITGLSGGLVSSTAVTLSFARQSREKAYERAAGAVVSGVVLAWMVSFVRVLVEVLIVNRALLWPLLPSMAAMTVVSVAFGGLHWYRARSEAAKAREVALENPFSLTSAIKFAAVFAVVLLVVKLVQTRAPATGLYFVAALAGTTDVDAITLSMANYARTGSPAIAANSITIAVLSNTLVKTGMVLALGSPALRRRTLFAAAAILVAGVAAIALGHAAS